MRFGYFNDAAREYVITTPACQRTRAPHTQTCKSAPTNKAAHDRVPSGGHWQPTPA
jgi:hypothetical protein